MMNMLDDPSKKVQAVRSWGWIISLLGTDAVNNRSLLNKLLKVPERMFIDVDAQVQIAAMVGYTIGNVSGGNHNFRENPCKPWRKSRLNSPKKSHM